jgi:hypothetical protein
MDLLDTYTRVTTTNSFTELHIAKITVNYSTQKVFSVFTSPCLVATSNGNVPLPLGFQIVRSLS